MVVPQAPTQTGRPRAAQKSCPLGAPPAGTGRGCLGTLGPAVVPNERPRLKPAQHLLSAAPRALDPKGQADLDSVAWPHTGDQALQSDERTMHDAHAIAGAKAARLRLLHQTARAGGDRRSRHPEPALVRRRR